MDGSEVLYKLACVCDEVSEQRVKMLHWKVRTRKCPVGKESSIVMNKYRLGVTSI